MMMRGGRLLIVITIRTAPNTTTVHSPEVVDQLYLFEVHLASILQVVCQRTRVHITIPARQQHVERNIHQGSHSDSLIQGSQGFVVEIRTCMIGVRESPRREYLYCPSPLSSLLSTTVGTACRRTRDLTTRRPSFGDQSAGTMANFSC